MSSWYAGGVTTDDENQAFESAVSDFGDSGNEIYGSVGSTSPSEKTKFHKRHTSVKNNGENNSEFAPLLNPSRSPNPDVKASFRRLEDDVFFSPSVSPITSPELRESFETSDRQVNVPRLEDQRTSYRISLPDPSVAGDDSGFHILSSLSIIKPYLLFSLACTFSILFAIHGEHEDHMRMTCVSTQPELFELGSRNSTKEIVMTLSGPFPSDDERDSIFVDNITVTLQYGDKVTEWNISIQNGSDSHEIDKTVNSVTNLFNLDGKADAKVSLILSSSTNKCVAVSMKYNMIPITKNEQIIVAFLILLGVYILIIFELTHRTTAAMLGGLAGLAALSVINKRPSLEEVVSWLEVETLSLLFGMMTLVAVFAETGFFDYVALKAYKFSKGRVWPLIYMLCTFTGIISAFLDNVTTILLFTPVTIRLCQVLNINPTYVLIAEVIFSNVGGTATAIGDPPNVIIVSTQEIIDAGFDFKEFTSHLAAGIFFCFIISFPALRLLYCRINLGNPDPPEVAELKREADIWKRTSERVPTLSPEEKTVKLLLVQKYMVIENTIKRMTYRKSGEKTWKENLLEMEKKYTITNVGLLVKTSLVLTLVIILFFIHSIINLGIGWIALMGAILLIILADLKDVERVLEQVEWTTLIFFAGLFVLMESLSELGLITFIGEKTGQAIKEVDGEHRLLVAIIVILWVSALASSFIDNIPFTTAMIPVILELHNDPENNLPLRPLVLALAMGACLGGNGTLVGASANVVCAGIAEQHGCTISFNSFTKIGFPMMIITTLVAMVYLIICHHTFQWDNQ